MPRSAAEITTPTLQIPYRPPYDWPGVLAFLRARALEGVEWVTADAYARTAAIDGSKGWIRVTHAPAKRGLALEYTQSLAPVLPMLVDRVHALFDLRARPDVITKHLLTDERLADAVRRNPGLRVPGAFSGFETGLRAILGQQITVKAATTIACRFVEAFGEPMVTPFPQLRRLTPAAARVAAASVDDIARLKIVAARARSIIALAEAHGAGRLCLDDDAVRRDPDETMRRLTELPGIGPWTAHYIAMRALHWPDAFPKEDVAVRNGLGGVSAREAEALSQAWRPWRSYAVMHLWRMAAERPGTR